MHRHKHTQNTHSKKTLIQVKLLLKISSHCDAVLTKLFHGLLQTFLGKLQIKKKKMEIHRDLFEAKPAFDKLVSEGKTYLTKGNWNPPLIFFSQEPHQKSAEQLLLRILASSFFFYEPCFFFNVLFLVILYFMYQTMKIPFRVIEPHLFLIVFCMYCLLSFALHICNFTHL